MTNRTDLSSDISPRLQVYQCLEKFASEPTYVSTHIVNQEKAQFPAITICPISKGYKEDVLLVKESRPLLAFQAVNASTAPPPLYLSISICLLFI